MFTSLKTKLIAFIVLIMAITAAAMMFATHRHVGRAILEAEESSARNVLELAELNISTGYNRLISAKIEILRKLRAEAKDVSMLCASVLESFVRLADSGRLSDQEARAQALAWIKSVRVSTGNVFLFDRDAMVLAHQDPEIEGNSIADMRDLKGRYLAKSMRDDVLSADGASAVFSWQGIKTGAHEQKIGYFVPLERWQWTLAIVVDFRDIEAESQQRMTNIIAELKQSFAKIQVAKTGYAFMFDGNKRVLIAPSEVDPAELNSAIEAGTDIPLLDALMSAARSEQRTIHYVDPFSPTGARVKTYINHFKAFDWYFAVAVPEEEIAAPAAKIVTSQSIIIGLIILGSLVVAYLMVVKISKPLESLTRYARELSSRDFTLDEATSDPIDRLPEQYNDEVGRLAEAFVKMRAELVSNLKKAIASATDKEAAERSSLAKSDFLATISHELRTPLNGILGYAQILRRQKGLPPKSREGLEIIRQCGEHLMTLINDILDLAKVEAGKMQLEESDFALDELLYGVAAMIEPRAEQKGIEFRFEIAKLPPGGVVADERKLRQVLINLLGNAVKFTEHGHVRLGVSRDGDAYRFEVEDTGIGVSREQQEKIFDPFTQVDSSGLGQGGTGLGLAISRQVVEFMGGELGVESSLGQGSRFWFELKLAASDSVNLAPSGHGQTIVGYEGPVKSVLIVDDQPANRAVLLGLLGPLGFQCSEAVDGAQCLEIAENSRPDLILMDIVMPKIDGLEATRRLRKLPKLDNTRIIALSASAFDVHRDQCLEAGCDAFLPKPIAVDKLHEQIVNLLELCWITERQSAEPHEFANTLEADDMSLAVEQEFEQVGGVSARQVASADAVSDLPEEVVSALWTAAKKGHAKGILGQVEALESSDTQFASLASELRRMVREFQFEEILTLIGARAKSQGLTDVGA